MTRDSLHGDRKPVLYQHRSTCACGWKGPWRWLYPVAWLDYYTQHRWNRRDRYWNAAPVHRPCRTA